MKTVHITFIAKSKARRIALVSARYLGRITWALMQKLDTLEERRNLAVHDSLIEGRKLEIDQAIEARNKAQAQVAAATRAVMHAEKLAEEARVQAKATDVEVGTCYKNYNDACLKKQFATSI